MTYTDVQGIAVIGFLVILAGALSFGSFLIWRHK